MGSDRHSSGHAIGLTTVFGAVAGAVAYGFSLREYGDGATSAATQAVIAHYLGLLVFANLRLLALLAIAGAFWGAIAGVLLRSWEALSGRRVGWLACAAAGSGAFALVTAYRFCRLLQDSPASVVTLWPYATSRLDPIYDHATGPVLDLALAIAVALGGGLVLSAVLLRGREAAAEALARGRRAVARAFAPEWAASAAFGSIALVAPLGVFLVRTPEPAPRVDPRPNFLLLMSDSLRADRVEAERAGEPVMPNVANLAAEGTTFHSCFVPTARTTESVVAMMTGTWPQAHGIRSSFVPPDACRLAVTPLPRALRDAGYETDAIGDWSGTDFAKFDLGFDRTDVPPETWSLKTFVARGGRLTALIAILHVPPVIAQWVAPELPYYPGVDAAALCERKMTAELEALAQSPRPFFLVSFTGNTHAPFTPAGIHHRRFSDPTYRGPNRFCLMARTVDDALKLQSEDMKERDLAQLEAVYDAAARTFDDQVGHALSEVSRLGLAKNTIVLVLSDHGTAFYERGSFGQGNEIVSDVSNRIPFVLHDPRRPDSVRHVDHVVRSIDIAPTILELASAPVPATVQGRSVLRYVDEPALDLGLVAYGETGLWIGKQRWQEKELDFGFPTIEKMVEIPDWDSGLISVKPEWIRLMIRAQHRMIRTDRWKLVFIPTRHGFIARLYDVALGDKSPDVAAAHPDVVARLLGMVSEFIEREPEGATTTAVPAVKGPE